MRDTFERLKKVYLENAGDDAPVENFTEDAELVRDLGCDSVTLLYMAMSLEEEFGISFSNTDLQSFKTVGGTVEIIERLMAEKNKKEE